MLHKENEQMLLRKKFRREKDICEEKLVMHESKLIIFYTQDNRIFIHFRVRGDSRDSLGSRIFTSRFYVNHVIRMPVSVEKSQFQRIFIRATKLLLIDSNLTNRMLQMRNMQRFCRYHTVVPEFFHVYLPVT